MHPRAMQRLQSWLQGAWTEGEGEGATLANPTTGEGVATTSTSGLDFAGAVDFARRVGGPALRALTNAERGALLMAMSKTLHEHREQLIDESILNAGTTRGDSKFDIDGATGTLAYYAKLAESLPDGPRPDGEAEQLTRSKRFFGLHVRTPLTGVAVHVNAFNFPAWGFAEKAAVALLAGVPVITKPATATALPTWRCIRILADAGILPDGALQFVCGSPGDLLTHLRAGDVLAFTGSGVTGAKLRRLDNVVEHSVRVNVEADSLNATVLCPDVEVGSETWFAFVRDAVREITQKTGQKCTATRRIFVPKERLDDVLGVLAEELGRVPFGDPKLESVRVGPLASAQQHADVKEGIEALVAAGAKIAWRGEGAFEGVADGQGCFVHPHLLQAAGDVGLVHDREVFGPVSTVVAYDDVAEVPGLVARGQGGLVAAVYGNDKDTLRQVVVGLAPWSGRVLIGSKKVADQAISPGLVLPSCVHGGPGRAGGGEELGGVRGLDLYTQRTAIQGDRALLDKIF